MFVKESVYMFEDILGSVREAAGNFEKGDVMALNPLVLAYIGDAVYEMFVRTMVIASNPESTVHKMHVKSTEFVKAHAQFDILNRISPSLTEEELNIVKRGRNSKSGFVPKNADVVEYRMATGFEALIGYLYLTGNNKRLIEILYSSVSMEHV